jgi:hypothetical protein
LFSTTTRPISEPAFQGKRSYRRAEYTDEDEEEQLEEDEEEEEEEEEEQE